MLAKRLLVAIILLPIALFIIHLGGPVFNAAVTILLGVTAWEYVRLFRASGLHPASLLAVGGVVLLAVGRALNGFESAPLTLTLLVLASIAYHVLAYERGASQAGTDFSVTMSGAVYAGWLGAYLISIRDMPDGKWWLLVVLPSVWLADSGAYFLGQRFGRHPFSPLVSPKKTWEGYVGGMIFGTLGGGILATIWSLGAGPGTAITLWTGAFLGFVLTVFTPLGDLGESMIKRQAGVKDSGTFLPGHGGAFDRIDSWLWAAPIGYYVIFWFFQ